MSKSTPKTTKPAKNKPTTEKPVTANSQESKNNTEKDKNKKNGIIIGVIVGVLAIICAIVLSIPQEITAVGLIKTYAKNVDYIQDIIEQDNPDGILGEPHEYISKSSWDDSRLQDISEDHAGTIEVFRNEEDAKIREWHLGKVIEICDEYISVEKYGADFNKQVCSNLGYGTTYRNGTVLVRLSGSYSDTQIYDIKSAFNDIIGRHRQSSTDIPTEEQIQEIKEQKEKKVREEMAEIEKENEKNFDSLVGVMDKSIKTASESLADSDLKNAKENLAYLKTIPYFADKISNWESEVKNIEDKIAQNKAEAARKAAEEEKAKKAAKTRTFSAGKYVGGKDIDVGTYNITAVSGHGNFFLHNASDRLQVNEMMSPSEPRWYISSYKNAYIGTGYSLEITSNLVLRFEIAD